MGTSFKVGEAPWEKSQEPKASGPSSYKVGEAPWETKAPTPAVSPTPAASDSPLLDEAQNQLSQTQAQNSKSISEDPSGLGILSKHLDWPGGVARTELANLLGVVKPGEPTAAIRGVAPSTSEYLKRLDVPEGPHVNLMPEIRIPFTNKTIGKGDTSARDMAGFIGDQGLNPLTYMGMGSGALADAASPVATATENGGTKLFKSGLKKVDESLIEKGQKPVSDVLLDNGVAGTNKQILSRSEQLAKDLNDKRAGLLKTGDEAGAKVDMSAATDGALLKAKRLQDDPGLADLGDKLAERIQKYRDAGLQTPSTASEWKTNLYNALPDSAYNKFGNVIAPVKGIEKSLANGFKTETEKALSSVEPTAGSELASTNQDLGSLLSARKPLAREVRKANTKNILSSVDAGIAGYGLHDPLTAAGLLTAKKIGDLSKTTLFRTSAGLAMNRLGGGAVTGPAMDALFRESLPSPWMSMQQNNNGR